MGQGGGEEGCWFLKMLWVEGVDERGEFEGDSAGE